MATKTKYISYSERLKNPKWQKKRLAILERDEFTCRGCRSKENTLHVHHSYYKKGADPWDYEDEELVTLCDQCHNITELRLTGIRKVIGGRPLLTNKIHQLTQIESLPNGPIGSEWTYAQWSTDSIAAAISKAEALVYWQFDDDDPDDGDCSWEENRDEIKANLQDAAESLFRLIFRIEEMTHPNEKP